jgi:hypothetical protein
MSKELQRKVIEAGIVPTQAVRLLQMWRSLPEDLPVEEQEEKTQQQLLELVNDIGDLLEQDEEIPEMRETDFELDTVWDQSARTVQLVYRMGLQNLDVRHPAARTRQGGFFFRYLHPNMEVVLRPGTQIHTQEKETFEITQVSPRYVEDQLRYLVCEVQEVPEHAVVRSVPALSEAP